VLFWVPWSLTMSRVGLEGLEVFVMRWKWEGESGESGLDIWGGCDGWSFEVLGNDGNCEAVSMRLLCELISETLILLPSRRIDLFVE